MIDRALKSLDGLFERMPSNAILLVTWLTAIGIGVLDFHLVPDLLLLYLVPIFVATWYSGLSTGCVVALYSAGSAYVTQAILADNYQVNSTDLFNLGVRVISYLTFAVIMSKLRETRRQTNFIVHDLRSPIANAISGLMTVQQTSESLDDGQREMIDLALVSNQRALNLVNSLLDVAKLERGKFEVEQESVELAGFINDCFNQVELWAGTNRVTLEKNLLVSEAFFDPELTSRVVVNLLSNALKFSPDGGTVSLRAMIVHRSLRIAVEDQGPGIPKELIKAVFQPFAQVKGTQSGTGLGLTFCRLAIHAQQGHIWIDPDVASGTTVWFSIPQPPSHSPNPGVVARPTET